MPENPTARRRIAGERRTTRPAAAAPTTPESPREPPREARRAEPRRARAEAATPAATATATGKTRGRRWGAPSWLMVAALGVLVLVLALVAGLLASPWGWDLAAVLRHDAVQEASTTAPPAAERAAAAILSYSYKSLSADEKAAERYMTPRYRKDYEDAFGKLVRPNAGKLHARVRAVVKSSGVSHADPNRVEVLVYVDQTTVSTANGGQPQVALNRAMFTMQRSGGDWLVDKITSY